MHRSVIAALLATLVAAPVVADTSRDLDGFREDIDHFMESEMRDEQIPGIALAVVHKGQVVLMKGYGRATLEHEVPVTTDTLFQSGSIGKMFTAAAVMRQVEQGKMGLEDPVTKYVPEAPASWRTMTIRHLLTHTSGVANLGRNFYEGRDFSDETYIKEACAAPLDFTPGARWNYSNTGYALLGAIVKRATGRSYLDILGTDVFKPLGMSTARPLNDSDIVVNRASGYQLVDGVLKNQDFTYANLNPTADGALYFSIKDMIAWNRGVEEGKVLSAVSWKQVLSPVRLNSGKTYPYGFGWGIEVAAGAPLLSHGGAWQGFRSYYSRYLADDLAVMFLTNAAQTDLEKINEHIAGRWDPRLIAKGPKPRREPAVERRLARLIELARSGSLTPQHLPLMPAEYMPMFNQRFQALLRDAGALKSLELLERSEKGDDIAYAYTATFARRTARVHYEEAPGNQVSFFMIQE